MKRFGTERQVTAARSTSMTTETAVLWTETKRMTNVWGLIDGTNVERGRLSKARQAKNCWDGGEIEIWRRAVDNGWDRKRERWTTVKGYNCEGMSRTRRRLSLFFSAYFLSFVNDVSRFNDREDESAERTETWKNATGVKAVDEGTSEYDECASGRQAKMGVESTRGNDGRANEGTESGME
jgi:hypothetical protein